MGALPVAGGGARRPPAGRGVQRPPTGGNPREARGCGEEQARAETLGRGGAGGRGRGCGEGARVWEVASEGQPDGVGGEESAQQQTTPVPPFFYSRDDL